MSESHTLLLGFIAGATILLGLPIGRLRTPHRDLRHFLNAIAVGILVFLLWDVLSQGWEPIDAALGKVHDHTGGVWPVAGYGLLLFGTLALALISLHFYEQRLSRGAPDPVVDVPKAHGPGALAVDTFPARRPWHLTLSAAHRLSLLIAIGIGLHNFGEGLAIGSSAARGEISVATVLVIGFALHNATEGFGIVAPLAAEQEQPSWAFLLLMGLIGGGPTFLGAAVGHQLTSDAANVVFMGLAAGSILYVIIQLLGIASRNKRQDLLYFGLLVGLAAGFLTDMIVTAGGA
jgi:ZIP family zinc transporter